VSILFEIRAWASPLGNHGIPNITPAIINGNEAKKGEFPYQAILYNRFGNGWHSCSGSIISAFSILTAAHCVRKGELVRKCLIYLLLFLKR
jgi:secreted trypsin-like serine protease